MPIFTFSLWSQSSDYLDQTPIHKLKFPSSVSEPGGARSFSRVPEAPSRGHQTLISGVDSITCPTAPPLGDTEPAFKYHKHKAEDSDTSSDSSSEREEYKDGIAHQLKETLHLGDCPWPPRPESHSCPQQKALLQAQMHGKDMSDFRVYPVVEKPDPKNPQAFIRVHEQVSFKTLKELTQACTVYGPTAPLLLNCQSTVGDSALLPEDWMGIAKACPAQGNIYCGKLATQSYVENRRLVLLMEFQLTRTCYLVRAHLKGCLINSSSLLRLISR
jgi:hypothetical protein